MKVNGNDPAYPGEQGHGTWNQTWCPGMPILLKIASEQMAGTSMTQLAITDQQLVERAFERAHALIAEYNSQQEEPPT